MKNVKNPQDIFNLSFMKNFIVLIFVSICSLTLNAQRNNAADKLYRNFAYLDAAKLYIKTSYIGKK